MTVRVGMSWLSKRIELFYADWVVIDLSHFSFVIFAYSLQLTDQLRKVSTRHKTVEALKHQLEARVSSSAQEVSKLRRDVLALKGRLANAKRSQEKAEKLLRETKCGAMSATVSDSHDN